MQRLGAIVLCGGQSRRMGRPKAWLPVGGEKMLQRVVRLVSSRASIVVVSAAMDQDLPPLPLGVERICDPEPDLGPLQGLAICLASLTGRVEWAYATATDAPLLDPRWIDRLLDCSEGVDLVLPHVGGRDHPLSALYRTGPASHAATAMLRGDCRRLGSLRDVLRTREVSAEELREADPDLNTLRNANDPSEYRSILERICIHQRPSILRSVDSRRGESPDRSSIQ